MHSFLLVLAVLPIAGLILIGIYGMCRPRKKWLSSLWGGWTARFYIPSAQPRTR